MEEVWKSGSLPPGSLLKAGKQGGKFGSILKAWPHGPLTPGSLVLLKPESLKAGREARKNHGSLVPGPLKAGRSRADARAHGGLKAWPWHPGSRAGSPGPWPPVLGKQGWKLGRSLEAGREVRTHGGPLAPGGSMDPWGKPEPLGERGSRGEGGPKNTPRGSGTGLKQTIHFLYA